MIFVYCETCGLRIPNEDVESKKAQEVEANRWICAKCSSGKVAAQHARIPGAESVSGKSPAGDSKRRLTPVSGVSIADAKRKNTPAGGNPAVSAPVPTSAQQRVAAPTRKPLPLVPVAGGAAVLFTVGAVVFALSSTDTAPVSPSKTVALVTAENSVEAPPDEAPAPKVTPPPDELPQPPAQPVSAAPVAVPPDTDRYNEEVEKMRLERGQSLLNDALAYASQKPDDIKGFRRKLEAVLRSYRSTPAGDEAVKRLAELPQDAPPPPLDEAPFANALNALIYVDLKSDKVGGTWEWDNGALKVHDGRFMIPYDPGGEYDLRVTFSRLKSGGPFGLYLRPDLGKQFLLVLGQQDRGLGFSKLDGKSAHENRAFARLKEGVVTNKRHTVVAQMRKNLVRVYFDGQYATQHETDFKDLAAPSERALKDHTVLGVFSDKVPVVFHSFEIAEISGKGKFIRAPVNMAASTPDPEKTAPDTKASDPVAALKSPASAYESAVWNAFALAAKDGGADAARARLEAARKDPALAERSADLALDLQIAGALVTLHEAAQKGVDALTDRRHFKLERIDGRKTTVGKGSRLNVKGFKNGKIVIEERVGGASAESQLDLEMLTFPCRIELARIGVGDSPDGAAALAAGLMLASLAPESSVDESLFHAQLENASRLKGPAVLIDHLKARGEALGRERAAEKLFAEARTLTQQNKNDDARARLAEFIRAAIGTAFGERTQEETRALLAELRSREFKPGLSISYFVGEKDNVFQKHFVSRIEPKLKLPHPWPKDLPRTYWAFYGGGVLRVEQAGSYVFQITADDYFQLHVGDRKIGEVRNKRDVTFSATLTAGDNPLRFIFEQHSSNQGLSVKWKVPGSSDFTEIPESVLWYDPSKASQYEQSPRP